MMIEFNSPVYSEFTGELEGLVRYLDYGNEKLARREKELTLQHFHRMHPCCPLEVLREGLNFVTERSKVGRVVYPLYELSECRDEERKKDVRLFAFASEERTKKPAVIVCAGGGYGYVCNLVEGFPVAMRFARLGYPVFVLNYRVGRPPCFPLQWKISAAPLSLLRNAATLSGETGSTFYAAFRRAATSSRSGERIIWATLCIGCSRPKRCLRSTLPLPMCRFFPT